MFKVYRMFGFMLFFMILIFVLSIESFYGDDDFYFFYLFFWEDYVLLGYVMELYFVWGIILCV